SDTDLRGIFLPPADLHWSLSGVPEQYESQATEECYWELQKFLTLALKANPNVMECLYTPLVEYTSPLAEELLERREIFLSKIFYQTYNGYVLSQFKKLEADLRNKGVIKWKHAMHLIRLLISGTILLNEGVLQVRVNEHRERLLAIRNGQMSWDDIDSWRLELHQDFDEAFLKTKLPDHPDYEAANDLLVRARRTMT
ncbi:MAG: nucleotidyltransferase domain-containing protein, partial [Planctomycetota bacterium]|nr:nucleotidyltransferase domain-containing protein [Planctomycetota bacterium]